MSSNNIAQGYNDGDTYLNYGNRQNDRVDQSYENTQASNDNSQAAGTTQGYDGTQSGNTSTYDAAGTSSTYDNSRSGNTSEYNNARSSSNTQDYGDSRTGNAGAYNNTGSSAQSSSGPGPDAPLTNRMTQDTGGAIKPVPITERESKAVAENHHHGTRSTLGEKISNALDFPGINSTAPPAQQQNGL